MPRLTDDEIREQIALCDAWLAASKVPNDLEVPDVPAQIFGRLAHVIDREFYSAARTGYPRALADLQEWRSEVSRLRDALSRSNDEISQTLGKALGYPRFSDDQKNFPGATGDDVCVGEHVAETLAMEAARELQAARATIARVRELLGKIVVTEGCDAGVVLLSYDGPTHAEEYGGNKVTVYDHEYFSPLGDALMEIHQELEAK